MRFSYAGAALIGESGVGGALLRRYIPGPGMDEPVVWYEGAGLTDRRWLAADERGSVIAVSDAAGTALAINRYDEYGIPASTNAGRFQYTGQTWLAELGMYNYKARIYSPSLGRFLQTDPIGYGDGMNWYNYVGGDPVNFRDPSGEARVCVTETGSRIKRCVDIDADGDGDVTDNDLTSAQRNSIETDFHGAIVANAGRNISGFGKAVVGLTCSPEM